MDHPVYDPDIDHRFSGRVVAFRDECTIPGCPANDPVPDPGVDVCFTCRLFCEDDH